MCVYERTYVRLRADTSVYVHECERTHTHGRVRVYENALGIGSGSGSACERERVLGSGSGNRSDGRKRVLTAAYDVGVYKGVNTIVVHSYRKRQQFVCKPVWQTVRVNHHTLLVTRFKR